jgi:ligand-binding sensor domain-containing protein/signal transduction histidine kinase
VVRTVLHVLLALLFPFSIFAQQAKQYSFKHFSMVNGLASNTVSSIIQDKDGYIWMATVNGLQRFDGSSFITFTAQKNNPSSIPADHINWFFMDRKKNLWLESEMNNIGIFDTKKFVYRKVTGIAEKGWVRHMIELPTGELLLLQEGNRLFRYDENKGQFVPADQLIPGPPDWVRTEIKWDSLNKKYWISSDSGLVQFDPVSRHLNYRGHNIDNDPTIKAFEKQLRPVGVYTDPRRNLNFIYWPPSSSGARFYRFDKQKNAVDSFDFTSQLGYHEVKGMLRQRNGRFWLYGMPYFAEWDETQKPLNRIPNEYKNELSTRYDYAYNAYEDRENNIWIATDNGVYVFNPDKQIFNTYNLARPDGKPSFESMVQAMEELKDGTILVGCWGSGLFAYDRNFNPIPLPKGLRERGPRYSVWDMATNYKTGDLWITNQGGIIGVYNQKTGVLTEVTPEIFGRSTIRQVDEDTSGNLWFGTHNGRVIKWDYIKSGGDPSKGYELICQTGMVQKVHFEYQGFIWVATMGRGLLKIDAKTNKVLKTYTPEGEEGDRIFMNAPGDMTHYNDTTLLVAAGCVNIVNTRTGKITFFTTADGLPSNTIQSIEKDEHGILWLGLLNGICRLNLEKRLASYYDRRDGIAHDKFSMTGIKELSDRRLAFFTDRNFLVFDPDDFGQQETPPTPYITAFKLAGASLSLDSIQKESKAILKYNNTAFAINFSSLSYLQQRKVHYFYMLEGLDETWIHADRPMEVVYNHLAPGTYTFMVKSENTDGITSKGFASLVIVVRAPIWKTWWFYSLIALFAIAILYLLDRERMNRRRSMQQMRSQIGLNLHNEVNMALNNINVLSEIAKIKADKNIEQSKEYIGQISDKSRHMIEAMDDMLWSIDPQNDSMKKTLLRIKELTDGLRIANNVEIDLIVDNKVQMLELDMKLRHELFFFYKDAINFMVHHLYCQQVFVNINKVRSKLMLEILSECMDATDDYKAKFKAALGKRIKALPATIDLIAEQKSFAVVLYIDVK